MTTPMTPETLVEKIKQLKERTSESYLMMYSSDVDQLADAHIAQAKVVQELVDALKYMRDMANAEHAKSLHSDKFKPLRIAELCNEALKKAGAL